MEEAKVLNRVLARVMNRALEGVETAPERAKEVSEAWDEYDWGELAAGFLAAEVEAAARSLARARGEEPHPGLMDELKEAFLRRYHLARERGEEKEAIQELQELARLMIKEMTKELKEATKSPDRD